ncbi:MAG: TIGR02206 family membrane protein [Rhodothermales bacterium]|nr:TIGR02206 family membrane protein [Rhodothermales bacterium]
MGRYFEFDYSGAPFELFGPAHLWTVLGMALAIWLIVRAGRGMTETGRRTARWTMAASMAVMEIASHSFWAMGGAWSAQTLLPLHMCGIMTYVSMAALVFDLRRLYPLVYFLGIGGAIQAIITPDAAEYGYPHFRYWEAMFSHGVLVLAGFWVVIVERAFPTMRDLWETFAGLNVYALFVYFVNAGLGSNYLYVNGKPDIASALDLMPDWPYYILVLEAIALGLFLLMYLPFWWRRQYGTAAEPDVSVV